MNTVNNNNATTANSVFANSRMGRMGSRSCNCISNNCNCTIPAIPVPAVAPNMLLEMFANCENCEEKIPARNLKKVGSYKVCTDCATEVEECNFCCELVSEYETDAVGYVACDNCRDNGIEICDECGFFFDYSNEGLWIENESICVCSDCLDANFRSCDSCNEYYREERLNTDDNNNWVCDDCYERNYARCCCCDNIFSFDELIYDEYSGQDYCQECYEEEKNKIHEYSYKPEPIFHGSGHRYFGVELEIADGGEDNDNALKILESVDSEDESEIYCKHDSSLNGEGFEIVSHPMTLDYHKNEMDWKILMEAADNLGYTSQDNDECGLHVHVSRDSLHDCVIGNCVLFIDKFFDEEILSITRRTEKQIDDWAKKYDVCSFEGVDVNNEKEVYTECCRRNQKDRYYCINLRNRNTIEFRIFKGTLSHKVFISTIEFVDSVVEFAEYIFSESLNMNDMEWEDYVSFVKKEEKYKELLDFLNSKGLTESSTKIEKSKEFKIRKNILVKYLGKDANVIIPDGVTSIGDEAFDDCTSLTSITIPDSVVFIGRYAFSGCTSLTSITIPDGVTEIGDFAFDGCTSLKSVIIPDSVTYIGSWAFSGCVSLTKITIPDSVTCIESWAFYGCKSLTSVTIPDSVTSIGESAFSNCKSLTSITIPDSVTSIGSWAFAYCISLTNVTIPDGVITIENYTFSGCTSLTNVTIPDSVAYIGESAFENCGLTSQLANAI